jgi:membrane protein required for colicin V production
MIDLIFAVLMILAVIKGYQKGLIIALFSIIALIVGLAAALKLSAATGVYLQHNTSVTSKWLPVISFAIVFIVIVILVNLGGKLIEKTFEMALLGWANRIAGILLYVVLYTIIFSVFLFYADKIKIFERTTIASSHVYPIVQPLAPAILDKLGNLIPLFKDSFSQLEAFFGSVSTKIQQ